MFSTCTPAIKFKSTFQDMPSTKSGINRRGAIEGNTDDDSIGILKEDVKRVAIRLCYWTKIWQFWMGKVRQWSDELVWGHLLIISRHHPDAKIHSTIGKKAISQPRLFHMNMTLPLLWTELVFINKRSIRFWNLQVSTRIRNLWCRLESTPIQDCRGLWKEKNSV